MSSGRLYIGTRRYSSWSLRGWLMVRLAGLDVEEMVIPLGAASTPAVKAVSPNGLVPYLEHGGAQIWESLAIAEYCAELAPQIWPADRQARAHARSISAEMHAGFRDLRQAMPMNLGRECPGIGQNAGCVTDLTRIEAIWMACLERFGGKFLFGETFTVADAMFAPVVARLLCYQPPLGKIATAYCANVRNHALVTNWYVQAAQEPVSWRLDKYESIV